MRIWRIFALIVLPVALDACVTRATYRAPLVAVPLTFTSGPDTPSPQEGDWWKSFNDPVLTSLVTRALAANPDMQEAAARIREAREQEWITRGNAGPQINASAQGSSTHLSKNSLPSALASLFSGGSGDSSSGTGIGLPDETFKMYQLGFDASWELDLFGSQRRANEAAAARKDATIWSARDAAVTLISEVANTYEQYRALQRRSALADDTLATLREALEFIRVRAKHGLVGESDIRGEERNVEQAEAQREDLAAQATARIHALGILLGLAPVALTDELSVVVATAPAQIDVPPGLPSELLERRPDLRAAERTVVAATSDTGVATADLYPKFTLTGALQLASRSLTTLLEGDSLQDNISGRVSLPLMDRGRLHAQVRLRQAQADEAVQAYDKAILSALRDVEDALTRLDADRHRLEYLRHAALAAQEQNDLAVARYRNGLDPATVMLDARQAWQSAGDSLVQAEAAEAQDVVALYKALGGGWQMDKAFTTEDKVSGQGS